ncbi:hypothetical protein ACFYZ9_21475 [Streptomyces sp. NPDC001691]|uniref:hypothetical protein n=1 Tax=Streptomyces sp. NPDC001691 TaxID=3364600 RepID=UPI0036C57D10
MHSTTKHRITRLTATGAMLASGASVELRLLNAYGVPLLLALSCGLAIGIGVGRFVESVADSFTATVYRCRAANCSFQVRLTHASAAEQRRWQEAAASHPRHEVTNRP